MRLVDADKILDEIEEMKEVLKDAFNETNIARMLAESIFDMIVECETVEQNPPVAHAAWNLEIVEPRIGSDPLRVIGRCSNCGCTDSVGYHEDMGDADGNPAIWSGLFTNYFGHEEQARMFAEGCAEERRKRDYCPKCGARMDKRRDYTI